MKYCTWVKKMRNKEFKKNSYILRVIYVAGIIASICITLLANQFAERRKVQTAKNVVINLYTMSNGVDRIESINKVRKLCTNSVSNKLIEDYDDKLLYKYIEQQGAAATVRIQYATDSYVIYSIVSDCINEDRKFIFIYDTNKSGKICAVEEAELDDFVTDDY